MLTLSCLFCLRLAIGLLACLLLLSPTQVNPRFYRTHFLTVVGLGAGALVLSWDMTTPWLPALLLGGVVTALFGSVAWSLDGAPAGRVLILVTGLLLAMSLAFVEHTQSRERTSDEARSDLAWRLGGDVASAAILGAATTAMLMGHSYLIAPAMSLTPLMRLLAALVIATAVRMIIGAIGLGLYSSNRSQAMGDVLVWLPVRWALGFIGPLVLGWMAWRAARIRSTQSATGILYVVVIFCVLGELTGELLLATTGYVL
jgi:uncharacterized membrane protein YfcA